MPDITNFVANNIWLCIGVGILLLVVGDEVLGVSRALLSDPTENLPYEKKRRVRQAEMDPDDPLANIDENEVGPSIEDLLRPK